ncbi:unnamed protein product [Owenia fusiformis]|uniref:Uncharacterized protein n=1 Tax=Owenia fusiformis TaxID=6347 RepID=A0A8J1XSP0_OWEFU|nr:unnamed protein product [Owenia fusiformis]
MDSKIFVLMALLGLCSVLVDSACDKNSVDACLNLPENFDSSNQCNYIRHMVTCATGIRECTDDYSTLARMLVLMLARVRQAGSCNDLDLTALTNSVKDNEMATGLGRDGLTTGSDFTRHGDEFPCIRQSGDNCHGAFQAALSFTNQEEISFKPICFILPATSKCYSKMNRGCRSPLLLDLRDAKHENKYKNFIRQFHGSNCNGMQPRSDGTIGDMQKFKRYMRRLASRAN